MERIERENQKIAKKIFCLKSDLNKDHFEKDFQQHEAIKNNLARMRKKKLPQIAGKHGALPPMDEPTSRKRQGSAPAKGENDSADMLEDSQKSQRNDFNTVAQPDSLNMLDAKMVYGDSADEDNASNKEDLKKQSVASKMSKDSIVAGSASVKDKPEAD